MVNYAGLFTVISNVFLLIPGFVAWDYGRLLLTTLLFISETFFSSAYHICDFSGACLFSFSTLHHLDYFHAQLIMVRALLYIVWFTEAWLWLEWILLLLSALLIVILQITLPGELYVQAIICGLYFVGIIIYWIVYANTVGRGRLPPYRWEFFTAGISLMAASTILYSAQLFWPEGFWLVHAFWHIAAAIGFTLLIYIKPRPPKWVNAASRISKRAY